MYLRLSITEVNLFIVLFVSRFCAFPTALATESTNITTAAPVEATQVGESFATGQEYSRRTFRAPDCHVPWESFNKELSQHSLFWKSDSITDCYNMTVTKSKSGPIHVRVKNHKVISPHDTTILTMNQIFDTVQRNCYHGCPKYALPRCHIIYNADKEAKSSIKSVSISFADNASKDDINFTISNLTFCDSGP